MNGPVAVPIRVDAAWVEQESDIAPPNTQFSRLSTSTDGNIPWLGDTSNVTPDTKHRIEKGIHLHWTLPQALRRGTTVYVLDYTVFNELVQQGVPCELVAHLKKAATRTEYSLEELNDLLDGLASNPPLNSAEAFALRSAPTTYDDLISSDENISVQTYMRDFDWDPIFRQVYGPLIVHLAARMKLPPVPDRWLIVRQNDGDAHAWVVESDRLTRPDADTSPVAGAGPTSVPAEFSAAFIKNAENAGGIFPPDAFQYLGLTQAATEWSEQTEKPRLTPLTASGHGSPDFAAFYPNCQGVFGFHDAGADADTAYEYTIIGWFADPANDPVSAAYNVAPWSAGSTPETRVAALGWNLADADWQTIDGSIYSAKIKVTGSSCALQPEGNLATVDVAIGNTAGEALAAYIARNENQQTLGVTPEDILNAAQAGVLSRALDPDGPAVIENALHAAAFQSEPGGWIWQLSTPAPSTAGLAPATPSSPAELLDDRVARALNDLNTAQIAYDRALEELRGQRQALFTDWCRGSHLATDSPRVGGETPAHAKTQLLYFAGNTVQTAAESIQTASVGTSSTESMLMYQAMQKLYLAHGTLATMLQPRPGAPQFQLQRQPAPRYWRPNDPVIMMTEDSGNDLQTVPPASLPHTEIDKQSFLTLRVFAPGSAAPAYLPAGWDTNANVPAASWIAGALPLITAVPCAQSWRPLALNWSIELWHYPGIGSIDKSPPDYTVTPYAKDFLTQNFEPDATGIDLIAKKGVEPAKNQNATYRGRVTLSSHAGQTLKARILQLTGQTEDPPKSSADLKLPGALGTGQAKSLIDAAYDSTTRTLSQTLNGFNDHLLMLQRLAQISIFDPLFMVNWFSSDIPAWDAQAQSFYDEIGLQKRTSPAQNDTYNPFRTGVCALPGLTLVDSFGQSRHWTYSAADTFISDALPNETAKVEDPAPAFFLAPRLAQASRLLFRWLAADGSNDTESNQVPDTTPVCGWLALNRVDETILVFLQDGTLIGWIDAGTGAMTFLPGKSQADIKDPYLKQVVLQAEQDAAKFYDDIDNALLTIEPRSHAQQASRSVLESRPLALARAALQLQLLGPPSPHQGYEALAGFKVQGNDDTRPATGPAPSPYVRREDCGFTEVDVPVRLGDVSMDDDGLVLYWSITGGDIAGQYTTVDTAAEVGPDKEPTIALHCAPDSPPTQSLLLLDPRAPVHVTSGLLPVKAITIPPTMYAAAVRNMEYIMQIDPVLTPPATVSMPLPAEIRGKWNYIYRQGDGPFSQPITPAKSDDRMHPVDAPAVLRTGYLQASQDEE